MKPREPKKRLTIYISPALRTWLRHRSAATDKSVSEIAEDLMILHIGPRALEHEDRMQPAAG